MTDDESWREWWRLMRRAFKVPDIIRDENARLVILGSIVEWMRDDYPALPTAAIGNCIISAVLELAATGELDHLILPDSMAAYLKDPHPLKEDLLMITDKAEENSAFPRITGELSPWPREPQGQMAKALIDGLKKEVKRQQHFT
jgi:hypothetical protein